MIKTCKTTALNHTSQGEYGMPIWVCCEGEGTGDGKEMGKRTVGKYLAGHQILLNPFQATFEF